MITLTILSFVFSFQFILGALAGAAIALILKNNLSKKDQDNVQALLDQANAKVKDLEAKVGLKK